MVGASSVPCKSSRTVSVIRAWHLVIFFSHPSWVKPGPKGARLSRDALERRLSKHLDRAATTCSSLKSKHVTMHTLRHTAAMRLLAAGVDTSVIALWLGHQNTASTDVYLHADMTIKQNAIDRTRPLHVTPGTYAPEPDILAWLDSL